MAKNFAARKDGKYLVICSAPDVCKLPNGVPVPFPIIEPLSNSTKVAKKSRYGGKVAFMLKSHTTKVTGDQGGVAKGVKSGTMGKKAEPIDKSKTVKVEGSWLVRVGDKVNMNSKNTFGKVVFAPAPQMGVIKDNGAINDTPKGDNGDRSQSMQKNDNKESAF